MRHAPAVRVACLAGPLWRALPVVLQALTAAALVGWPLRMLGFVPLLCAAAAGVAMVSAAAWSIRQTRWPRQYLQWDGTRWSLADDTPAPGVDLQRVDVMLDLGHWLLLRAHVSQGAVRWLPVNRRDAPGDFRALCCALFARAGRADIAALPATPLR